MTTTMEEHLTRLIDEDQRDLLTQFLETPDPMLTLNSRRLDSLGQKALVRVHRQATAMLARIEAFRLRTADRLAQIRPDTRGVARELALAMAVSDRHAERHLDTAQTLLTRLPAMMELLDAGLVDEYKASKVVEATAWLSDEKVREADVLIAEKAIGRTPGELRRLAHRIANRIDPDGAAERVRRRRRERSAQLIHQDTGMATLLADLPVEKATAMYSRLDRCARALKTKNEPRTLDQLRADVLADLVLAGTASGSTSTKTEVCVYVDLHTLLALNSNPAELAGHGPIPAPLAREIAHQPDSTWRRLITDPATGQLLEVSRRRYRPPTALSDYIRHRDRECRAPGCHHPAHHTDIDHVHDWAHGGPTNANKLIGLCRRHHRLKDEFGWHHHTTHDGTLHITTPAGHTYTTTPEPLHQPRPQPDDPPF